MVDRIPTVCASKGRRNLFIYYLFIYHSHTPHNRKVVYYY